MEWDPFVEVYDTLVKQDQQKKQRLLNIYLRSLVEIRSCEFCETQGTVGGICGYRTSGGFLMQYHQEQVIVSDSQKTPLRAPVFS